MTFVPRPVTPMAVAPRTPNWVRTAIELGGGFLVEPAQAEGLVWLEPADPAGLSEVLQRSSRIRWVQLPWAGVDAYAAAGTFDSPPTFTSAKGIYSRPVAEHALTLALAGKRDIMRHSVATEWGSQSGSSLFGASVTIVGRGGIAGEIAQLLVPFECGVTLVARQSRPSGSTADIVGWDERHDALATADVVFLALPLTAQTAGVIAKKELQLMAPHAWLVNVARGEHIATDDLLWALRNEQIAGAALDVTDPEPLPSDHGLWSLSNCLITPHTAIPWHMAKPILGAHIEENVRRFGAGEPLRCVIDSGRGY